MGIVLIPIHKNFFIGVAMLTLGSEFTFKDYAMVIGVFLGLVVFGICMRTFIVINYLHNKFKYKGKNETKK